ncbi:TPA: type IV secretion system DNA-binding domain-containing protein [Campylobacter fetus subsp. venerealis]|uniref:P-type type IV conjugative transfer system ATPase TrbE/VirB4 n=2 Tax=Campylobacter fetus TaxID=196 RepID=A0AAE6J0E8_CAMFE|nr:type IV secretion system DNA-binding domain-containing protein [Campylobacter fetus]OCS21823.1 AAA family ATPase [Campylobacter fetus subsp. venerealis cfvi97/532]OCS28701.1 AAA family ATPase [Campylobacter fetus subsp. venerealis LMG 6570 = CCUG 33900]OCS42022.1 AAA family ATPase [Campylobacter fetus subsp. venerealis cfvi02/298]AHE95053.1 type IV secretion system, conjugal transfer ATPase, VirB4 family [Campylobacter fetus subsp. venerealis cfvi03/293]EAK0835485.1 AAA family ATPase [Campy
MARGLIDVFKDWKQNKQNAKMKKELGIETRNAKNESQNNDVLSKINKINQKVDTILTLSEPQIYTLAKENNIACKYGDNAIITKDGNISIAVELKGVSYAGISLDNEMDYLLSRVMFFTTLKDDVEINLIIKKTKEKSKGYTQREINPYAKDIIEKWEINQDIYAIRYLLIISTTTKNITGMLENFKTKMTSEQSEESSESTNLKQKLELLNNTFLNIKNYLSTYQPRQMSGDEIINFYATYSNAQETNLSYTNELITDCYISSYVEFKKDYIEFYRNDGTTKYARFISVKAYETEQIKSVITSNLIKSNNEFMVMVYFKAYEKRKAIKKIKDTRVFSVELVKQELDHLMELIQADRENLVETSFSIYCLADDLKELDVRSNELKNILENQGLNVVRETINQKALYFSLFPSRGNLNARKKTLNISNLATIANFENEVTGFNKNDWGDEAVTTFRHLNGTPYLFNFHWQPDGDRPAGHTMIMGGTGSGKTTTIQFLMANLFKYKINIFALDKLRGMYNFTNYMDGEYHDSESDGFKLNPFSLADTIENREFLTSWLGSMAEIKVEEHEATKDIRETINRLYDNKQADQIISLSDFIDSLPADNESKLKTRFGNYKDSIFDNKEDALNFTKQLSVLNMDGVLQNKKISALTAMYVFHRLKNQAKNSQDKRGFFCFIDELKDYLRDEVMSEKILEGILEWRKIGGVGCFGFQSISLFNGNERGSSFLDNIANFIIFPTNSEETLKELSDTIGLTPTEAKFLKETQSNARQVLLKMKLRNESAKLNLDISSLGNYLRVFSSSSDNVILMKKLKADSPVHWRKYYLEYKEQRRS